MSALLTESLDGIPPLVLLGITSGILSLFAFIPYIADTLARRTEPHRASWFIWSVLSLISFFSQVYEGAGASLWFAGVQSFGTCLIFLISIRFGFGGYLSRSDGLILAAAALGIMLWYYTDTAAYALGISIGISLLGGLATIAKAYREPDSETLQMWGMSLIASFFAVASIAAYDLILLAYPLYLLILNTGIVTAILIGRETRKTPQISFNRHVTNYPKQGNVQAVRTL